MKVKQRRQLMPDREMVSTGIPRAIYEALMARAEAEGKTRSTLVREFIKAGLETPIRTSKD